MRSAEAHGPIVVVLGDINVDILARVETYPRPGEDCLAPAVELRCGGVGANIAFALAGWGASVRLLGSTGLDYFGDFALDALRRARVDVSRVQRSERVKTGLMFIPITPDGQRTIFGCRGANAEILLEPSQDCLADAGVVHLVGYNFLTASVERAAAQLLEEALRRKVRISLDVGMAPSQQIPQTILRAIEIVNTVFVSLGEAQTLTGESEPQDALERLESGAEREVVVKLGARGGLIREAGGLREVPGFPVCAVDTTGAGDAFAAAFLWARLRGWSRTDAALLGNAAGAAAACVIGAGEALPGPREVLELLRKSRLDDRWEPLRRRIVERLSEELQSRDLSDSLEGRNGINA